MMHHLDLHMHSNVSNDGEYAPSELIHLCSRCGLTTVALSDHNSVRGLAEASEAAKECGIGFIRAVELDCRFEGVNLHMLGYGINLRTAEFDRIEKDILHKQQDASHVIMKKIHDTGICFDDDKVWDLSVEGVVTGEMIAQAALQDERNRDNALLEPYRNMNSRSDNPFVNFYWDFCSQGKPADVPVLYIDVSEAVGIIRSAGGIAVLAHPGINIGQDRQMLAGIAASGLDGIEVYSSYHNAGEEAFFKEQAERFHLQKTMGSDFHGKTKPAIVPGGVRCREEEDIYRDLKEKLNK